MKRILVIEDNPEIRENTGELLSLANYAVTLAENGKIGVELAIKERPDLIICDIMMPELDGYGVLHVLSKRKDTSGIPFIFLTALGEKAEVRRGMELGADDYLTKPFDETSLFATIEARLRKSEIRKNEYETTPGGLSDFIEDARLALNLKRLGSGKKVTHLKRKSELFAQGGTPAFVYLVQSGQVKVSRLHQDGKELITNLYGPNDFFGYEPVLYGSDYKDTAVAIQDSEIIFIPKEDFLTLLFSHTDISAAFISLLCKRVLEKEQELLNLAYSSTRQRTATVLLKIFKGKDQAEPLTISREDLSKQVGTAPESVIRVLSHFKEENLVSIEGGRIRILAPDKLQQVIRWNFPH
jgi:CRP-like cAMP-binding protein/CheY-like chemotaxis protein